MPHTGSVTRHGDHWDIRITLANGKRSNRLHQPPEMSEARALEKAAYLSAQAAKVDPATFELAPAAQAAVKAPSLSPGETFGAWSERWLSAPEAAGQTTVDDQRGCLRKWVLPRLGPKPFVDIVRLEIEQLVEELDTRVQAGELSWKTAANVWGLVTKACDDAKNSKTLALRILGANPRKSTSHRCSAVTYASPASRALTSSPT